MAGMLGFPSRGILAWVLKTLMHPCRACHVGGVKSCQKTCMQTRARQQQGSQGSQRFAMDQYYDCPPFAGTGGR